MAKQGNDLDAYRAEIIAKYDGKLTRLSREYFEAPAMLTPEELAAVKICRKLDHQPSSIPILDAQRLVGVQAQMKNRSEDLNVQRKHEERDYILTLMAKYHPILQHYNLLDDVDSTAAGMRKEREKTEQTAAQPSKPEPVALPRGGGIATYTAPDTGSSAKRPKSERVQAAAKRRCASGLEVNELDDYDSWLDQDTVAQLEAAGHGKASIRAHLREKHEQAGGISFRAAHSTQATSKRRAKQAAKQPASP